MTKNQMGQLIPFAKSEREPDSYPLPPRAIDDPRAKALQKVADTLRKNGVRKPSDRERVARNWHKLLGDLQSQFGLKNKAEIYKVLQRANSDESNAQKRSQEYEIAPSLTAEKLEQRRKKITQRGDRWLLLAERAAEKSGQSKHHWLPTLLEGTSLAPGNSEPTPDTPEPIRALLDLVNAACGRIAETTKLGAYFDNLNRGWVRYSSGGRQFRATCDQIDDLRVFDPAAQSWPCCTVDEEGRQESAHDADPIPSAEFADKWRFGPTDGQLLFTELNKDGTESTSWGPAVRFGYRWQLRLAIGRDELTGKPVPAIEIRPDFCVLNTADHEVIPFERDSGFDVREWLDEKEIGETLDEVVNGEQVIHIVANGTIHLEGRAVQCGIGWNVKSDDIFSKRERLESVDGMFDHVGLPYLDSLDQRFYCLLTEENVGRYLSGFARSPAGDPIDISIAFEDPSPGLTDQYTAMNLLERDLLNGRADESVFSRLLESARSLVERFDPEYQKALADILRRHREALDAFASEDG